MSQNSLGLKKIKCGNRERYSFAKVPEYEKLPYLIGVQKDSYQQFLKEGIGEVLSEFSPITDYSGKAELYFVDYVLESQPKHSMEDCKKKGLSYTVALKVKVRLVITETGEVKEQEVFLGDIPYMTPEGSFIFSGVERVIVSQIAKSPSVYYDKEIDKNGKDLFNGIMSPTRGTWIQIDQTSNDTLRFIIDRSAKLSAGVFLKCLGLTNADILDIFGNHPFVVSTLDKETANTKEEALVEFSRKTRPSEVPNANATESFINALFFSNQYNLAKTGRYKFNKKLDLATRITGLTSAKDIVSNDGELFVKAGETISAEVARQIKDSGINSIEVVVNNKAYTMVGNARVRLENVIKCNPRELGITEEVYYPLLTQILKENKTKEKRLNAIKENAKELQTMHLTIEDILATVSYELDLIEGLGRLDEVDHLANRRVATVGELVAANLRIGMTKLSQSVKEHLQAQDLSQVTPASVVNARPINKALKDFVASSQLSQLLDNMNPLAELTQKRRLTAVGPGGVKKERASAEVRDINHTHYGRICIIETPEGSSIGLINSIASFAHINEYGFIEVPYRKVDKEKGVATDEIVYLMADEDEFCYIAQANEPLTEDGHFVNSRVVCRYCDEVTQVPASQIDYIDVAPNEPISVSTSLIPFVENNMTARAQYGSNMQRQAVPLLRPEAPFVGTGLEAKVALDSGAIIVAKRPGVVTYVDAMKVEVTTDNGEVDTYTLTKFFKSNHDTCINQRPAVRNGQKLKMGDLIADSSSTDGGELAIGRNLCVAFVNWEGYNYEDAILINERLVKEDILTSITLKVEEIDARATKLGDEEITRDIPNVSEEALANLDERGIIRVGAEVMPDDILVGKVTPKGETELTPEERLLRAIFGEKARDVRDTSLRVDHGSGGVVVDVQVLSKKNKDELPAGVHTSVKVYIAQKRKMSVGDKMAGRHGNKGVVSIVMPEADMPYLANGQQVDIILNPLGVQSRMNIGQLLDTSLGLAAKSLGIHVASPAFDGAKLHDIEQMYIDNNLPANGKFKLFDGRTGEPFDNDVTVGYMYMIKLEHMVDNKMHARSTGKYTLVTQQPLGGKAMMGGQKFGEMEVWGLEAYGASTILQEILTIKSDDVAGRTKAYEAIVKGEQIAEPGIPEAFKVLVKELQAIGLDIKILNDNNQEIDLKELSNEENEPVSLEKSSTKELEEVSLEDYINNEEAEDEQEESTVFDESSLFDEDWD